jgi:phage/plasmid-associated DNA primase
MDPLEKTWKFERLQELINVGPNDVYNHIIENFTFIDKNKNTVIGIKTIADPDSEKELIYIYADGFYIRGESRLKEIAEKFLRSQLTLCFSTIEDLDNSKLTKDEINTLQKIKSICEKKKHQGVMTSVITEAINMVRRNTYTDPSEINPPTHIPFRNGLLNLKTWNLDPLTPEFFYTWYVNANYLNREIDPSTDFPLFLRFLSTLVPPEHIFPTLFYMAYTLYPGFPVHKTLWIVGRQRIGKGSLIRLLHLINPEGHGTISVNKMLRNDFRFDVYSIVNKNFVTDAEVGKINNLRPENWDLFNKLFGGDFVDVEGKYKQKYTGRLHVKGIFVQNLPMLKIENPATIERIILVQTRTSEIKTNQRVPNIEELIFKKEGNEIATYLANLLKILEKFNFIFPEIIKIDENGEITEWREMEYDEKTSLLEMLSDPVQNFIEEMTERVNTNTSNDYVTVEDAYAIFEKWCNRKGIVPLKRQVFTKKFSQEYPKKRERIDGKKVYVFTNIKFVDENSMRLGQGDIIGKDTQYNDSSIVECLSQLINIKLITWGEDCNDKGGVEDYDNKLVQSKKIFKIITGLNFRYKEACPDLFIPPENLREEGSQGSGQESKEGIPIEEFSKIEQGSSEGKGVESISDSQALKDYHYFRSEEYFPDSYFNNFGIQNIEHKQSGNIHYYKIPYSEILEKKYYEFSSRFSSNSKVFVIDEKEFDSIERKEEKEK